MVVPASPFARVLAECLGHVQLLARVLAGTKVLRRWNQVPSEDSWYLEIH